MHRDLLGRGEELEFADVTEGAVVGADEQNGNTERLVRPSGTGDNLRWGPVASHRIDGDREDQLTSMAWRPWYQPQFGHTTCGVLEFPHWGQVL
jgi:hypothetical protein